MNRSFFRQNRKAIQFLLIFVGLYFALNVLYTLFIQRYYPTSDPYTRLVASQVVWFLSLFDSSVTMYVSQFGEFIAVANDRENMIYVYEGHNGLNVMIVYISFMAAFPWPLKHFIRFAALGVMSIYLLNLGRLSLLYAVTFYLPEYLYFFQKYMLQGILYCLVFALWYLWVRKIGNE